MFHIISIFSEALEMAGYLRAVDGSWVAQTKHIWYLGEGAERHTITEGRRHLRKTVDY